jgi:hypothetical protein
MTRDQAQERLEAWMNGDLDEAGQAQLRHELAAYPDLLEEFILWQQLREIPSDEPSPALSGRLNDMLNAFRAEAGQPAPKLSSWDRWLRSIWPSQPAYGFAAAFLCLILGLAGGWIAASSRGSSSQDALLQMQQDLQDTRELAVLAMLQQPMAGDRLRGVSYVADMPAMRQTLQQALIRTLQQDSSVNVRLAALDAISGSADELPVRVALQSALGSEESPLMQLQLLRVLAAVDHPEARQAVEQAAIDDRFESAVREAAAEFLQATW